VKAIEAFVELVDADGAPRVSVAVTLQHFRLSDSVWVHLASVTTDDAGKARLRVPMLADDAGSAPALRLVRADTDPVAVLSEGGRTVYAASTGILSVEFGRIRTIDSTEAPALVPRFRPAAQTLGGIPAVAAPTVAAQFDDTLATRLAVGRGVFLGTARTRVEADTLVAERNRAVLEATQKENDLRDLRTKLDSERVRAENAEALARAAASPNNPALQTFQVRLDKLNTEKADITAKFQARERELDIANTEREQLRKEAERKAAQVAAFEAEKKQVVPIATLATNVQSQIAAAQNANAENGLMRISGIKIKVRGKLGDNGAGITLPGNDAVIENAGGTLDEVAFEIDAPDTTAIPTVPVPDVIRLTETAARQVLASLGFRADAIAGGSAPGFVTGQAVRQSPAGGTPTPRGSTVLIVFAG
jgi:PASTA domain